MRNLRDVLFKRRESVHHGGSPAQNMIPGVAGVAGARELNPVLLDADGSEIQRLAANPRRSRPTRVLGGESANNASATAGVD